ncbi:MAG: imidazole glycerol phosphate synthase subunit HisF [Opitutae bacterium]|nr:imidazole glycerol phosphate synthase subunit HisF [Opitutae bacterium]
MNNFRVIPVLLLQDDGLVKTRQFKNARYVGDPINAIKIFNDKEVDELIFLDIDASKERRGPNFEILKEIASECFMPLGYGGGITSMNHVDRLFQIGLEKVVLNSVALTNPDFITEVAKKVGSQSVVVSIDVKQNWRGKRQVYSHHNNSLVPKDVVSFAKKMEQLGAGEIFLNSVNRDGMMSGYDLDIINQVAENISLPLVACGGAGSLNHMQQAIAEGKASAVGAGSLFIFHGTHKAVLINYPKQEKLIELFNGK